MNRVYLVELLYRHAPAIQRKPLLAALRAHSPSAAPLQQDEGEESDGLLAFVHANHVVRYADGEAPAQVLVKVMREVPRGESIQASLRQSWKFDDAADVVAGCGASVIVSDAMASGLPHRARFHLLASAVMAVLEVAPAAAIHWSPSQQVIQPDDFESGFADGDLYAFAAAGLNVRYFDVADGDGEMVMDTLGLHALGLPDLQCHFRDIDPDEVGRYLHNMGLYTYEHGDVIDDGATVEGLQPGTLWRFQRESALVDPEREVIDVDPGDPYAAGERER